MNPVVNRVLSTLFARNSPWKHHRWTFLGADGRVLDVDEHRSNSVGQSIPLVAPATGTQNILSMINAQSENPANPETITISLGIEVPGGVAAGAAINPQAQITWGSAGSRNTAIVDILNGTQVTIAASFVQVDGIYNIPIAGLPPVNNIRINANLSYGTRAGSYVAPGFSATHILDKSSAMSNTSVTFLVPAFAKDVIVYAVDVAGTATAGDIDIFMTSDDGGSIPLSFIAQHGSTAPNTVFPMTYPLPGLTRAVTINNVKDHATQVTIRFGLSL